MLASFLFQALQFYHLTIFLAGIVQFLMGAKGSHGTLVNEEHLVHLLNGGDTVGNQNGGLSLK